MNKWTNEQMIKWTKEQMNEWTNEQMNKWANEQMNKWTNGQRTTKVQHKNNNNNLVPLGGYEKVDLKGSALPTDPKIQKKKKKLQKNAKVNHQTTRMFWRF